MKRPLCSLASAAALTLLVTPALGQPGKGRVPSAPPAPGAPGTEGEEPPPEEPPPPPEPEPPPLGGHGESCRARADCQEGLRCLDGKCTDPHLGETCGATADCGGVLRCIDNVCGGPQEAKGGKGAKGEGGEQEEEDEGGGFEEWAAHPMFDGTGGFVGLAVMGGIGLGVPLSGGSTSDPEGSFLFGLKGGVLIDRIELALEFSPVTYIPFTVRGADPNLQVNATFGYHIPISDMVSWPLRVGAGIVAVNTINDDVYFQARADALGLSINYGHLLFDAHFPSFRFITEFDRAAFLDWLIGGGIAYAF